MAHSKGRGKSRTWSLFHQLTEACFQPSELMTLSVRRIGKREKALLKLWNSRWRRRGALLPRYWSYLPKLLCMFREPWYCRYAHKNARTHTCECMKTLNPFNNANRYQTCSFLYFVYPSFCDLCRCWLIVAATGRLCSVCVGVCGTKPAESPSWYRELLSLKHLPLSQQTSCTPSSPLCWCWLRISSWTC